MRELHLRSGGVSARVSPDVGSRVSSLAIDGVELLVGPVADPIAWGCYPMVPFAGRVRDARLAFRGAEYLLRTNAGRHSIHGTVFDTKWEVVESTRDTAVTTTTLGDHWPFPGSVVQMVTVDDDGITMRLAVHADVDQPVQVGWHPWFVKPESVTTGFTLVYPRDRHGISVAPPVTAGDGPWDDCFLAPGAVPRLTIRGVPIVLSSDCDHWVVYDEPRHATCIEPQSGPPNAVNDGPEVVAAGGIFSRWFRIERA